MLWKRVQALSLHACIHVHGGSGRMHSVIFLELLEQQQDPQNPHEP